jgi:trans-aconitate 2-methyltransferase
VAEPQLVWGLRVLERLPLAGDERVLDAGCGSGRLTARLAGRLPRGRVLAVDLSANMVRAARRELAPLPCDVVQADLARLPVRAAVDAVFSAATFHWVLDHDALFASLRAALRPGGRLVAQCGGAGNLDVVHERAHALMGERDFAPHFRAWREPWRFEAPDPTAARLERAGFGSVRCWLEPAPTPFESRERYAAYVRAIILRPHLARLPDEALRDAFVDRITDVAERDDPPLVLDYVRLNIDAARSR